MSEQELLLAQDPVGWLRTQAVPAGLQAAVLQGLARRAEQAPVGSAMRTELLRRLQRRAAAAGRLEPPSAPVRGASPLAGLLAELAPADAAAPELRALSRQRRSWAELSLQRRLQQAPQRAPAAQVGPLNADALMPRALARLQALSPDYLQRLVAQVDALVALAPIAVPEPEPARAGAARRRR